MPELPRILLSNPAIDLLQSGRLYQDEGQPFPVDAASLPHLLEQLKPVDQVGLLGGHYWLVATLYNDSEQSAWVIDPNDTLIDLVDIQVFAPDGSEVDPMNVDWSTDDAAKYRFRQDPGSENAMASVKINFPSPDGVYMHDTPQQSLFGKMMRFDSSGCVRVDKVAIMLDWILQGQDGLDQARIAGLAETKERLDVNIANAPQLRVAYLTAWPAKDGVAAFRKDVGVERYFRDARAASIMAPTSDVLYDFIGKAVCGMPVFG